ncbi:Type 1 glutamine amidotransferase-like domain-containing protein [Propionibacteriaceae bacterium Y1923]|uniref:Type 1 glutamine amidotransferase-like domain-containing protein n=1 Tax=Aestuariimicrobium sp. Y1814 TaxID=3418742 RepID=UPI003C1EDE43
MTLFLVGGAPSDQLSDVHDVFAASVAARLRGAASRRPRVAYVSAGPAEQAQQYTAAYLDPVRSRLPEVEVTEVYLPEWPEDFDGVDAIIVAGGHTPTYLEHLAPHRDQLARLVRDDVHYLGYSAGAQVASRHALVGGWRREGRPVGSQEWSEGLDEVSVVDGLALITPTVATHSDVALHDGLLTGIVESAVTRTAVGIDEDTCLVVDPVSGRTAHYGLGRVRWFSREPLGVMVTTQYPDA